MAKTSFLDLFWGKITTTLQWRLISSFQYVALVVLS